MKIYKIATDIQTIFNIASKYRTEMMTHKEKFYGDFEKRLVRRNNKRLSDSECDYMSYHLVKAFESEGINAKQIFGAVNTKLKLGVENFEAHSWVEINGKVIVDITADQFGPRYPDVFISTYDRSPEYTTESGLWEDRHSDGYEGEKDYDYGEEWKPEETEELVSASGMKIYKIAGNTERVRKSFYQFIKAQNITVDLFHGTTKNMWAEMQEAGWMTPPTWRGKEKEEERYHVRTEGFLDEDDPEAMMRGLDKLFFTKDESFADYFASRSSSPKDEPLTLFMYIPLHQLDEIKGNVSGDSVYNEAGGGKFCKEVIDSGLSNQEKLDKILDYMNSNVDGSEWTIKGGLPLKREEGFEFAKDEDKFRTEKEIDEWVRDLTEENAYMWDSWGTIEDPKVKFNQRVVNAMIVSYSRYLREDARFIDLDDESLGLGDFRNDPRIIDAKVDAWIRILNQTFQNVEDKHDLDMFLEEIPDNLKSHPKLASYLNQIKAKTVSGSKTTKLMSKTKIYKIAEEAEPTMVDWGTMNNEVGKGESFLPELREKREHYLDIYRPVKTPKGIGRLVDYDDQRGMGYSLILFVEMPNGEVDEYIYEGEAISEVSLKTNQREKEEFQEERIRLQRGKAEKAGFDTSKMYFHGSRGREFDEFDSNLRGLSDSGWLGLGYYFSPIRSYAESYGGKNGKVRVFYLKYSNPFRVTDENIGDSSIIEKLESEGVTSSNMAEWLKKSGYDAVERWHGNTMTEVMIYDKRNIRDVAAEFEDPESPKLMSKTKIYKIYKIATSVLTLYHGTSSVNAKEILQTGLKRRNLGSGWYTLADNFEDAKFHSFAGDGSPVVIRFEIPDDRDEITGLNEWVWPAQKAGEGNWYSLRRDLDPSFGKEEYSVVKGGIDENI